MEAGEQVNWVLILAVAGLEPRGQGLLRRARGGRDRDRGEVVFDGAGGGRDIGVEDVARVVAERSGPVERDVGLLLEKADFQTPLLSDGAGVGLQVAVDQLQQRGLAGAVVADESGDLIALQLKRHISEHDLRTELPANIVERYRRHSRIIENQSEDQKRCSS